VLIVEGRRPRRDRWPPTGSFKLREGVLVNVAAATSQQTARRSEATMRSVTDVFVRHPVLALVVNLLIVLVGWRAALTGLPVQQYPKLDSASVIITTVYTGASAETVRGLPDHADRTRGVRDRRHRPHRVDEPRPASAR
jgi:hypothetical protein